MDKRVQDKEIKAGRNDSELAIYLDKDIVKLLGIKRGQHIVLDANKKTREIVIKF